MKRSERPIGFVLLTHSKPHQIKRLVMRLGTMFDSPPIVIHHDFGKCPLSETDFPANVSFVHPHVTTGWGDFSLVEATLKSFGQMYERTDAPDWCVLLSGDSYPTKPAAQILANLNEGHYDAHIDAQKIGREFQHTEWHHEYYRRHCLAYLDLPSLDRRGRPRRRRVFLPDALSRRLGPFRKGLDSFGGSQWLTLSRRSAAYITKFQQTPAGAALAKHYRNRAFADEAYFQTALCNAPELRLNLTNWLYLEWPDGSFHPKQLAMVDLEALQSSPTHFARKVDLDSRADLLEALDRVVDEQPSIDEEQHPPAETMADPAPKKKISVIIPCYNHAAYLGETIESVLAQTYPALEILVVDDGSRDGSAEVAERYAEAHPSVRLLRQTNGGRSKAANTGLAESQGNFLVFLDADDRLLPHALETGLRHLEAHPEAAFAAGHCLHTDAAGRPLETTPQTVMTEDYYLHLLEENFIWNPGTALFRRAAVEAVGGFDTSLRHAEDYNIYLRITRKRSMVSYAEVVAEYRQHPNNKSKSAHTMLKTMLTIMNQEAVYIRKIHDPKGRAALRIGIAHVKEFYGDRCMNQLRRNLGSGGDRAKAWATFKVIVAHCPTRLVRGVMKVLSGKADRLSSAA